MRKTNYIVIALLIGTLLLCSFGCCKKNNDSDRSTQSENSSHIHNSNCGHELTSV